MKRRTSLLLIVLLAAMLACAAPGVGTPAAVSSDPGSISTIVASTGNAAASQTAAVESPVSGPDLGTAAPGRTGTTIEQKPDGTTTYNDFDAGFEVTYPVGWLAVRPNSDEFNAALVTTAAGNTMLYDQMTADLAEAEAGRDRVYAYILRPDLQEDVMFGYSTLDWDSKDTAPLDNAAMGEMVQALESSGVLPGFRADTAQVRENGNAVMTIEIGGRFSLSDDEGGTISFYDSTLFFKPSPSSLSRMTFTFLQEFSAQISPDVRSIIESIRLLDTSQ